ncbi:MAG: GYDIA family GHMP kinase [Flavobacteriales bacterium]|nr:GYDIA family GHMP kinase [Flavobacteriales bacterium]
MNTEYYGRGKLLLTGEYVVLDGAQALAIGLNVGQRLTVIPTDDPKMLYWRSVEKDGSEWFSAVFSPEGEVYSATNLNVAAQLSSFLKVCKKKNPHFELGGKEVVIKAEFDRKLGLGTSSTLIYTLGQWAQVNPFDILFEAFSGSGYDIAAAEPSQKNAILYSVKDKTPHFTAVDFSPSYADELFFVYRGQKQNSRDGISAYRKLSSEKTAQAVEKVNDLTNRLLEATNLTDAESVLLEHEKIIASLTAMKPVGEEFFSDYNHGVIKSLGAWGGDMFLATGKDAPQYFTAKGYDIIFPFNTLTQK